jgi:hypothetical protein
MASEALSIPIDIAWQRLAWSRDMLDRGEFSRAPKWHSSLTVYSYPVPLLETAEEYPDHRVVYVKLSVTITGWTASEELPVRGDLPTTPDAWQADGWDWINVLDWVSEYQPCLTAIAQVSIFPRPQDGTSEEDYPYFIDFEPKKRELYEAVTDTKEMLSGSANKLATQKGTTTTNSTEDTWNVGGNFGIPLPGGGTLGFGGSGGSTSRNTSETVDLTTTDASTERRETQGRSTQLSQMYQLFSGYHPGTNRALFVMFARPNAATEAIQLNNNLINGERRLEGVQDIFLVALVPRSVPGICVHAQLETSHKGEAARQISDEFPDPLVVTRRVVRGCGEFVDDRLRVVAAPATEPLPPRPVPPGRPPRFPTPIAGETVVNVRARFGGESPTEYAAASRKQRIRAADQLNLAQAEVRRKVLSLHASGQYTVRDFLHTTTFRTIASAAARKSTIPVDELVKLGYATTDEATALRRLNIRDAGDVFSFGSNKPDMPTVVTELRHRLLEALIKATGVAPMKG